MEQHLWSHYKPPYVNYTRNVHEPAAVLDAIFDQPNVSEGYKIPITVAQKRVMTPIDEAREKRAFARMFGAPPKPASAKPNSANSAKPESPKSTKSRGLGVGSLGRSGRKSLYPLFKSLDKDNNDSLSVRELRPLARRLKVNVTDLMGRMDIDGDGGILFGEFEKYFM